jgi:hypothetical protein
MLRLNLKEHLTQSPTIAMSPEARLHLAEIIPPHHILHRS